MCETCGCGDTKLVPVEVHDRIMSENDRNASVHPCYEPSNGSKNHNGNCRNRRRHERVRRYAVAPLEAAAGRLATRDRSRQRR